MKKIVPTSVFMITSLLMSNAHSADEKKDTSWKASAEIGYVSTTGNTDTNTLNIKALAQAERIKWKHTFEFTALNSSDSGVETAEKYLLSGQSDYKLANHNYIFGLISYEDDRFNGYDYQVTESVGYGHRTIDTKALKLDLEIGPGAKQSKLDTGETEKETLIRAAAKLDWTISKTSKLNEVLTIEAGEDADITKSVSSLTTKINGNLSMKVTYTYRHVSEVPVGVEKTDTETAVTLVFTF